MFKMLDIISNIVKITAMIFIFLTKIKIVSTLDSISFHSFQELYCVCQTPYDDSQFYVGCDGCEGWFHPQCVNITQEYFFFSLLILRIFSRK